MSGLITGAATATQRPTTRRDGGRREEWQGTWRDKHGMQRGKTCGNQCETNAGKNPGTILHHGGDNVGNHAPWRVKMRNTLHGSCNIRNTLCFHMFCKCASFQYVSRICDLSPHFPACFPTYFPGGVRDNSLPCPRCAPPPQPQSRAESQVQAKAQAQLSYTSTDTATQAQTQSLRRPNPQSRYGKKKVHLRREFGSIRFAVFLLVFFSLKEFATTPPPHTPHFNVALVLSETPSCFNPTVGNKDTACPEGKNV